MIFFDFQGARYKNYNQKPDDKISDTGIKRII